MDLALHTHVNHAQQLTPLVGKAVRKLLDMGFRDVRNQGVLLRGVNDSAQAPCWTCASRCSTTPRSCRTTSTCAT